MNFRRTGAHRLLHPQLDRLEGPRRGVRKHGPDDVPIAPLEGELEGFRFKDARLRHFTHHRDPVITQELLDARPDGRGRARGHHPFIAVKALNAHLELFLRGEQGRRPRQRVILELPVGFHAHYLGHCHLVAQHGPIKPLGNPGRHRFPRFSIGVFPIFNQGLIAVEVAAAR